MRLLVFLLVVSLIVWSLVCLLVKSRDTSLVNHAAQLESIFAPCLRSQVYNDDDMIKQINGMNKLKTTSIQWITHMTDGQVYPDYLIQQNHLRFTALLRMSHPESRLDIVHTDRNSTLSLSTWALEPNVHLHTNDEDIKSLVRQETHQMTILFDMKQSLFDLPVLLHALSNDRDWDVAVFHPKIVIPATFGVGRMHPWWIKKIKKIHNNVDIEELRMCSGMVWFKNDIVYEYLPNVLSCRSLVRATTNDHLRIIDYESAYLISATTAYDSYQ